MRNVIGYLAAFMMLLAASTHAEERFDSEKFKTGILPSGGFYSLYSVLCDDEIKATIANLNSDRRWCISDGEGMSCFSRKQDASTRACMAGAVAIVDDNLEGTDKYQ